MLKLLSFLLLFALIISLGPNAWADDFETLLHISEGREVNEKVEATRHLDIIKKKAEVHQDDSDRRPAEKTNWGRRPAFPEPKALTK